jgi:YbgC/YbaW family acyl-CoA thioester hydrolase
MARIKIELPEKKLADITLDVRVRDINYGNHLGNDSLVSLLHEARMQWLRSHNFTELNIDGTGLIMSDLAVEYKAESFYGDILTVSIFIDDLSAAGFDLYYSLSNQDNILIARAKTGMVCYNYEKKKVAPVPAVFKNILAV